MRTLLLIICLACLSGCGSGKADDTTYRKVIFGDKKMTVMQVIDPYGGEPQCFVLYHAGSRGGIAPYICPR